MYFPIHGHSLHSQLMTNTRPVLRILRLLLESQEWREEGIAAVAAAAAVPEASLGDLSSFINSFCCNGILGRRSIPNERERQKETEWNGGRHRRGLEWRTRRRRKSYPIPVYEASRRLFASFDVRTSTYHICGRVMLLEFLSNVKQLCCLQKNC